jgi:DNA-binding transcriptional ArsR family regulator
LQSVDVDFAAVAKSLASEVRSTMIAHLLEGKAMTAGELARAAGVLPPAASAHLAQLAATGIVSVTVQGRNRYFRIADASTAEALEALAQICPKKTERSLRGALDDAAQANARMCYDHVAGRLGVEILDAMLCLEWLLPAAEGFEVGPCGRSGLRNLGVDTDAVRCQRRKFARGCVDWTERRPHLAGALGASFAAACLTRQWIRRTSRRRGLEITPDGAATLGELLGIQVHDLLAR